MSDVPFLSRYTEDAPLALFTEFPPEQEGGGCMNIKSLLTPEDRRRILWITTTPSNGKTDSGGHTVRLGSPWRGRFSLLFNSSVRARDIARELADVLRQRRARGLWLVAHGLAVPVGKTLSAACPVPMHVTVNDDPVYAVAGRSRQLRPLIPYFERSFRVLLQQANSVEVMTENMRQRYRQRYGIDSVISNRGLASVASAIAPYDKKRGLRIGVLGNTYSYDVLKTMALATADAGRALGVDAEILVLGSGFGQRLAGERIPRLRVRVEGHVSEARATELLRETFLLYLGYPFGNRDAVLRQTSFPIKLVTYLQVGRPLLAHAAPDASTHELGDFAPFVLRWTNDDVADGARLIARSFERWSDEDGAGAAEAIRKRYFDLAAHRATTFGALNRLAETGRARPKSTADRTTL